MRVFSLRNNRLNVKISPCKGGVISMIKRNIEINLLLDDIAEIVNCTIIYLENPTSVNDSIELNYSLLSVIERINEIKQLLLEISENVRE